MSIVKTDKKKRLEHLEQERKTALQIPKIFICNPAENGADVAKFKQEHQNDFLMIIEFVKPKGEGLSSLEKTMIDVQNLATMTDEELEKELDRFKTIKDVLQ